MNPQSLLAHLDEGRIWPAPLTAQAGFGLDQAYAQALAVRQLRIDRGEQPRGFKVGFTNRTIWARYNVFAPIWGTVWDTTLTLCDGEGNVSLRKACQPRLEPETVFGLRAAPPANPTLDQLFDAIEWLAPGFEIVQSHLPDWKFLPADTVADGALHAHLLVGQRVPVRELADSASSLDALLANAGVTLFKNEDPVELGQGSNVLDSPLRALKHFADTLHMCPGAPRLQPGDVITTGTWTDAWAVQPGQRWSARFTAPLPSLTVDFTD